MLKHVISFGACLVTGTIVSVGLAWGAAIWTPLGTEIKAERSSEESLGDDFRVFTQTLRWSMSGFGTRFVIEMTNTGIVGSGATGQDQRDQMFCHAGWPCTAFVSDDAHPGFGLPATWGIKDVPWSGPIPVGITGPQPRVVPLSMRWIGFAVNAATFGLLPWMAWQGWVVARRRVRLARGWCAACGYDVRALEQCPECGDERVAGTRRDLNCS
jgi:hypothetical protein